MFASEAWSRDIIFKLYNSLGPNIKINMVNLDLNQVKNIRLRHYYVKTTSFSRNNDIIIASYVRWVAASKHTH